MSDVWGWAIGNNACFCDPIAPVNDCNQQMCTGFLTSFTVINSLCLVWVVFELIRFFRNPLARKGTRAKMFLLGLLLCFAFTRTIRYSLLLGKVGENSSSEVITVNILLIIGGANILSSLTCVLYIWRKVHAISMRVKTRFRVEKLLLWTYNLLLYFLLILLNSLEVSTGIRAYGVAFNIVTGVMIAIASFSFFIIGYKLYRAAISSGMLTGEAKIALRRTTLLTLICTLVGLTYVIIIGIFQGVSTRDQISDLVTRHVVYRGLEVVAFAALLITFRNTSSGSSGGRSYSQAARGGEVAMDSPAL